MFRSGKTSIIKLIFEKLPPGETLKLSETELVQVYGKKMIVKIKISSMNYCFLNAELTCGIHVRFQLRDVPGPQSAHLGDFASYASESTSIIFVLDVTVCL